MSSVVTFCLFPLHEANVWVWLGFMGFCSLMPPLLYFKNWCGNIPQSRRFFYSHAVDTLDPIRLVLSHSGSADGKTLGYVLKKRLNFPCSWSTLRDPCWRRMFLNCLLSIFHSTWHSFCHVLAGHQGTCCCLHPCSCPHVRHLHWHWCY